MRFDAKNKEEFNKSFEDINKKDKKGRTALHYAVGNSDPKTVRLLIKKGADINSADVGGYIPMHLAVMGERLENVKELIDYARNNKEITKVLEDVKIANRQGEF